MASAKFYGVWDMDVTPFSGRHGRFLAGLFDNKQAAREFARDYLAQEADSLGLTEQKYEEWIEKSDHVFVMEMEAVYE